MGSLPLLQANLFQSVLGGRLGVFGGLFGVFAGGVWVFSEACLLCCGRCLVSNTEEKTHIKTHLLLGHFRESAPQRLQLLALRLQKLFVVLSLPLGILTFSANTQGPGRI